MSDPVKEWFTVNELAEWLQMSPHTVYQWRYRGTGPVGHRIGRHLRFRREDVEAWLEQRRDKPTGDEEVAS